MPCGRRPLPFREYWNNTANDRVVIKQLIMLTKILCVVIALGLSVIAVIVYAAIRSDKDLDNASATRNFYDNLILKNAVERFESKITRNMEKPVEKRIAVTCGSRVEDGDGNVIGYETGNAGDGVVYKDREAFLSGKGICYIGEYDFGDMQEELTDLEARYQNSGMTDEEYREERSGILSSHGWTREKIVSMCGREGFEKVSEAVFDAVDWQEPSTYFDKFELTEEDLSLYGLTKEQVLKEWGDGYFD